MVSPILLPVFNPNFYSYMHDMDSPYMPTIMDRVQRFRAQPEYEHFKYKQITEIAFRVLEEIQLLCILVEIAINKFIVWDKFDRKERWKLYDICYKMTDKQQEYRYGTSPLIESTTCQQKYCKRTWHTIRDHGRIAG